MFRTSGLLVFASVFLAPSAVQAWGVQPGYTQVYGGGSTYYGGDSFRGGYNPAATSFRGGYTNTTDSFRGGYRPGTGGFREGYTGDSFRQGYPADTDSFYGNYRFTPSLYQGTGYSFFR